MTTAHTARKLRQAMSVAFVAGALTTQPGCIMKIIKARRAKKAQLNDTEKMETKKLDKMTKVEPPSGMGGSLSLLPNPPKKVALISYYVDDPGTTSKSGDTVKTESLSGDGAVLVATAFAEEGMETFRKQMSAHGMEVVTPDTWKNDSKKWETYTNFKKIEGTKLLKGTEKVVKALENGAARGTKVSGHGSAAGFQYIERLSFAAVDPKGIKELDVLMNTLEVDALVAVGHTVFKRGKDVRLGNIGVTVWGKNPEPKDPNKMYPGYGYTPVVVYGSGTIGWEYPGKFMTMKTKGMFKKKSEISDVDLTGYTRGLDYITTKVGKDVSKKIQGG